MFLCVPLRWSMMFFFSWQVEITGIRDDRLEARKPSLLDPEYQNKEGIKADQVPYPVLGLLQEQFTSLLPSAVILYQHYNKCSPQTLAPKPRFPNLLEIQGKEFVYKWFSISEIIMGVKISLDRIREMVTAWQSVRPTGDKYGVRTEINLFIFLF